MLRAFVMTENPLQNQSLLGLDYGVFVTLAIAGNSRLGGEDCTHAIALAVEAEYRRLHDISHLETMHD